VKLVAAVVVLSSLLGGSLSAAAPMAVLVSTAKGDVRVPVRIDPLIGPTVAAPALLSPLGGTSSVQGAWATVEDARQPFRFLIGAPFYTTGGPPKPMAGAASIRRDTLYLPLQFVTEVLPTELKTVFRYEPASARLTELVRRSELPPASIAAGGKPRSDRLPNGLKRGHVVTIDAGHGGVDPGNPGIYFPRGLTESDVTLKMSLLVREELLKRGVGVIMTRTTDTLIELRSRGGYCKDRCDLFVSLHVNSLPRRAGYTRVRGFETYFLAEARTEDAARVAKMENDAVRFEGANGEEDLTGGLDFILKDLQLNEHLRESGRLAELMQSFIAEVHSGPDKGVKQAGFAVLTTARRPAVLVEMGFSTNPEDAQVMTGAASQRNLAGSIADAIVAYLLEYERRVGSSPEADGQGGGS
jgi:N-acetylmuramoyl-L-alanine amidase